MKHAATLLLALAATTAQAEFLDGNALLDAMAVDSPSRNGVALGYVMGVFDTGHGVIHCAPANVTAGQARDVVRKFLEAMPQDRHNTADAITTYVLKAAWPCQEKKRQSQSL